MKWSRDLLALVAAPPQPGWCPSLRSPGQGYSPISTQAQPHDETHPGFLPKCENADDSSEDPTSSCGRCAVAAVKTVTSYFEIVPFRQPGIITFLFIYLSITHHNMLDTTRNNTEEL